MTSSTGKWYDGKSSLQREVALSLDAGMLTVTGPGVEVSVPLNVVKIDPKLGKALRAIRFPGGEVLESSDHEFLEILEKKQGRGGFFRRVHRWENRLGLVLFAFVFLALLTVGFVRFGIPVLADRAAFAFPAKSEAVIGREALQFLDKVLLKPTKLKEERRRKLTWIFKEMTESYPQGKEWKLEFRSSEVIGANAFALPSGIVIVTDRLVEIAKSDDELAGVMAHEVGHLIRRHALRHILRNSATALLVAALTGDLTSITSLSATLPTTLIDAKYSREFELEADDAAVGYLRRRDIPVQVYADILTRLEDDHKKDKKGKESRLGELFMDHPMMEERVKRIGDK